MAPIHIMAAVTTGIALAAFGTLFWQFAPRDRRLPWLVAVFLLGTLMSPAAYFGFRLPLVQNLLEPAVGLPDWPLFWRWCGWLARAPVTEEPAKLLPWAILALVAAAASPDGWKTLAPSRRMVAPLALALGLGFAMGEFWLVASIVAADPQHAGLAWYEFGGYLSERLLTCLTHTLFVLPTIWLARRRWIGVTVGLAISMMLHWLGNAPIALLQTNAFGWGPVVWGLLVQLWLIGLAIAALLAIAGAHFGGGMIRRILAGKMVCPECHAVYRQPILLGLNAGTWRYERCRYCKNWHWVTLTNLAPQGAPVGTRAENTDPPKPPSG